MDVHSEKLLFSSIRTNSYSTSGGRWPNPARQASGFNPMSHATSCHARGLSCRKYQYFALPKQFSITGSMCSSSTNTSKDLRTKTRPSGNIKQHDTIWYQQQHGNIQEVKPKSAKNHHSIVQQTLKKSSKSHLLPQLIPNPKPIGNTTTTTTTPTTTSREVTRTFQ